jgi:peptidoglycan/xylan/chitin deacetylase (PgdA/CDA1 family)
MRWLIARLSPAGARARLSILIFHRVLPRPDPLYPDVPDVQRFAVLMRRLRAWFRVVSLSEAVDRLYAGSLPSRALAITFDDGYADNEAVAAPILLELGLTATFFVATSFLRGGIMWNDRVIEAIRAFRGDTLDLRSLGLGRLELASPEARRGAIDFVLARIKHLEFGQREASVQAIVDACGNPPLPELMMREDGVKRLVALGMGIGAHTLSHPILARLPDAVALSEIGGSREALQALTGEPIDLFAYPNGVPGRDYAAAHVEMARRCGFRAAFSTAWGVATRASDRYQLPRFTPWDRAPLRFGLRMAQNLMRTRCVTA